MAQGLFDNFSRDSPAQKADTPGLGRLLKQQGDLRLELCR